MIVLCDCIVFLEFAWWSTVNIVKIVNTHPPPPPSRQALALAAACIHRTGGVHMQMLITPTVVTLLAVVRGASAPAKLWALHALWVIGNVAGPTYIQHVPDTQSTMLAVLLQDEAYGWPGLRPTLGRLANAMVAVMGPEFQLGSDAYVQTKAIIREMQVGGGCV